MKRLLLVALLFAGSTAFAEATAPAPAPVSPMAAVLRDRMLKAASEQPPAAPVDAGPPLDLPAPSDGGAYDVPRHLTAPAMVAPGNWVVTDKTMRQVAADLKTSRQETKDAKSAVPLSYVAVGAGGLLLGAGVVALFFMSRGSTVK